MVGTTDILAVTQSYLGRCHAFDMLDHCMVPDVHSFAQYQNNQCIIVPMQRNRNYSPVMISRYPLLPCCTYSLKQLSAERPQPRASDA